MEQGDGIRRTRNTITFSSFDDWRSKDDAGGGMLYTTQSMFLLYSGIRLHEILFWNAPQL